VATGYADYLPPPPLYSVLLLVLVLTPAAAHRPVTACGCVAYSELKRMKDILILKFLNLALSSEFKRMKDILILKFPNLALSI
jgi:hypothetical protein